MVSKLPRRAASFPIAKRLFVKQHLSIVKALHIVKALQNPSD
jgi:hypothetical protein